MTAPKPSKRRSLTYVCLAQDGISFHRGKTLTHLKFGDKIKLTDRRAVPLLLEKLIEEDKNG